MACGWAVAGPVGAVGAGPGGGTVACAVAAALVAVVAAVVVEALAGLGASAVCVAFAAPALRGIDEASPGRALNRPPAKLRLFCSVDRLAVAMRARTFLRCVGPVAVPVAAAGFRWVVPTLVVWPRKTGDKAMLTPSVQVSALQGEWRQAGGWFPILRKDQAGPSEGLRRGREITDSMFLRPISNGLLALREAGMSASHLYITRQSTSPSRAWR